MAIRDDEDQDLGWKSAGPGLMMRFLPKPVGEAIPLERVEVSRRVTTTETLKKGATTLCEQCQKPIKAGTMPTQGHLYGTLICQVCSEQMGRPSLVTRGTRRPGRPRLHEREES